MSCATGTTSGIEFRQEGDCLRMLVYRGKTIRFDLIWGDPPQDVSGWQAAMQLRDRTGRLMLEMSTANGKVAVDGPNGKFSFTGTTDDSRSVDAGGVWEIELITSTGEVYRAASGTVEPIEEIVR